jgi:hypothetical protein
MYSQTAVNDYITKGMVQAEVITCIMKMRCACKFWFRWNYNIKVGCEEIGGFVYWILLA